MKELKCNDVGFDCDAVIHGSSEEDVLAQAAVHARDVHGLAGIDDETAAAIRAQIHDAQMPDPVLLRPGAGEPITRRPQREVTIKAALGQVTVTESRYASGERGPDPHVHWRHIDAFYVLDGEMEYMFGRENRTVVAGAGACVLIPTGVVHTFGNESEADVRWLNIHAPDGGFAEFLRGDSSGFDSEDPPPDRGRPADDAVFSGSAGGERFERADRAITIKGAMPELSVLEIELDPGFTIDPHTHADHTDSFYVLDGEVEFTVGEDVVRAGPGTFLAAPPGAHHGFRNPGPERAKIVNLHTPDAGFAAAVRRAQLVEPQERYEEIADDLVARNDDVELAKMMGMPCVKRAGKMVAGFAVSSGAMVFKLPDADQRDAALVLEGAQLFDPGGQGRPFKEWVQVPAAHADRWPEFAEAALVMPSG